MSTTRFIVGMLSVGLMVLGASGVSGQDYPNKPIRIVTSEAGGGGDFTLRIIAQGISGPLGEPVTVDNRVWLLPLTRKVPYDPVRDLAPISRLGSTPYVLYVHSSLPAKSVKELIALAKARPGELNNSIGGIGGVAHLAGELFKSMAGVNIVAVPYRSNSAEIADLIGGRVQLTFTSIASMMDQVKAGRLRALAVTSAEPFAVAPDLPTIAASGLPGYEWTQSQSIFAPAKTPAAIINRLNQEIVRLLKTTEAKERLFSVGQEVVGSSPEQLAATIKSEMARVGKVIKDAGIKVN